jgi:hypothetical protein
MILSQNTKGKSNGKKKAWRCKESG